MRYTVQAFSHQKLLQVGIYRIAGIFRGGLIFAVFAVN